MWMLVRIGALIVFIFFCAQLCSAPTPGFCSDGASDCSPAVHFQPGG